jgi:anionic cell wall polymer biosynthesis LytR-Cps2A-Psr (LCP) family protein
MYRGRQQSQSTLEIHTSPQDTSSKYKDLKTVINLSGQNLVSSLLQKGLNYAVTSRNVPTEDILAGVEEAVQFLPVESAEAARQETVRVIKSASKPRVNLTRTERAALRNLKNNTDLTILPAVA